MVALTLDISPLQITDEEFYSLCRHNQELQFGRTAQGQLIVSLPLVEIAGTGKQI